MLKNSQGLRIVARSLLRLAPGSISISEVAQLIAFAAPVADLAGDLQRLQVVFYSFARLAQVGVSQTQVAQVRSFAAPDLLQVGELFEGVSGAEGTVFFDRAPTGRLPGE